MTEAIIEKVRFQDLAAQYKINFILRGAVKSTVILSIFAIGLLYKLFYFSGSISEMLYLMFIVLGLCGSYVLYYIFTEADFSRMIAGIVVMIIAGIVAKAYPLAGIVLGVIGIILMIMRIIKIMELIPLALAGIIIFLLLFDQFSATIITEYVATVFEVPISSFEIIKIPIDLGIVTEISIANLLFIFVVTVVSFNLGFKYRLKDGFLRLCVIFLAMPIMVVALILMKMQSDSVGEAGSDDFGTSDGGEESDLGPGSAIFDPHNIQMVNFDNGHLMIDAYQTAEGTFVPVYVKI